MENLHTDSSTNTHWQRDDSVSNTGVTPEYGDPQSNTNIDGAIENEKDDSTTITGGEYGTNEDDTPDTGNDSEETLTWRKIRKKHKNSRRGCSICKQRKIKCDQRFPTCSFCEKKNLQCSYMTMTPFQIHRIMSTLKSNERSNYTLHVANRLNDKLLNDSSYNLTSQVNLSTDSSPIYNNIHQVHEMERIFLDNKIDQVIILNSPSQLPFPDMTNLNNFSHNYNFSIPQTFAALPLSNNARISDRTFTCDPHYITQTLKNIVTYSDLIQTSLSEQKFNVIKNAHLNDNLPLDAIIIISYYQILSVNQIFNKLTRGSFFLFAFDYYKNILMNQSILPQLNYKLKISISAQCEKESSLFIDDTTNVIKTEYLPFFSDFSMGRVNLFTGCFMILNYCLSYHFKNGLRFEISTDESNKLVKLAGIFSTGFYSVVMGRSRSELLMSGTNILSTHLVLRFKRLMIKNYSIKLFDEFRVMIDKLSYRYINNAAYENLQLFCEKHSNLLKVNQHQDSLLGYNNGYLLRILNSYISVVPFDLCNYNPEFEDKLEGKELEIMLYFAYYALGHLLNAMIPSIDNMSLIAFAGPAWKMFQFDTIPSIMKLFNLLKNKKLQLTAIYLIRLAVFFKYQKIYHSSYLMGSTLNSLLDPETDLPVDEICTRLKKVKETGILDEIHIKTFMLDKGQFIKRWNYPNSQNLKPKRGDKVSENKIMRHFEEKNHLSPSTRSIDFVDCDDLLIEDFIKSNNGFLSLDFDPSTESPSDNPIIKNISTTESFEMQLLWKLSTFIRINNQ